MKRSVFILTILILLGIAVYFSLFRNNTTLNPFASGFALKDPGLVTKIQIYDNYSTISLEKINGKWNMGDRPAFHRKVEDLLLLASLIEISAPAPVSYIDSINLGLEQGTTITFFHNRKVLNSFSLCKYNFALYAKQEYSRKAYRISIRGYSNTDLSAMVSSNPQNWQQNVIIDLAASDIRSISVKYSDPKKRGYILEIDSMGKPSLFDQNNKPIEQSTHVEHVEEYLYFFSEISFYKSNKSIVVDELIMNETPFCELKITSQNSDSILINGHRLTDPTCFYASHPDFGTVFLNYRDFDPILMDLDYFLKN